MPIPGAALCLRSCARSAVLSLPGRLGRERPVTGLGGVDGDGVGEGAQANAGFAEVVDLVEDVSDGPTEPVEGVDDEHVAWLAWARACEGSQMRPGVLVGPPSMRATLLWSRVFCQGR